MFCTVVKPALSHVQSTVVASWACNARASVKRQWRRQIQFLLDVCFTRRLNCLSSLCDIILHQNSLPYYCIVERSLDLSLSFHYLRVSYGTVPATNRPTVQPTDPSQSISPSILPEEPIQTSSLVFRLRSIYIRCVWCLFFWKHMWTSNSSTLAACVHPRCLFIVLLRWTAFLSFPLFAHSPNPDVVWWRIESDKCEITVFPGKCTEHELVFPFSYTSTQIRTASGQVSVNEVHCITAR